MSSKGRGIAMKMLWCWRCKAEMPMLDEDEFQAVADLHHQCFKATREFREKWGIPLKGVVIEDRFRPVLELYERMTGMKETNPNAVMHHRLSMYGPPCKRCEKPQRTPQARLCGACMFPVAE